MNLIDYSKFVYFYSFKQSWTNQFFFFANLLIYTTLNANECTIPKKISTNLSLKKNCIYNNTINISSSNILLDCNGATIKNITDKRIGLDIDSKGKNISNILIKNCIFEDFLFHGVRIHWKLNDVEKKQLSTELYEKTPHDIVLENIIVKNSGKTGIYIDDYVSNVIIKNSKILNSGTVGMYLEHDSKNIYIINNYFYQNGYKNKKPSREALAIDSSSDNIIKNNKFEKNGKGGIFLYKNCSERFFTGKQVLRLNHSNNNLIVNNIFKNETTGIWLASRQSKNLNGLKCGDIPMDKNNNYYEDYANNNILINNEFFDVKNPIINEGDHNIFIKNSCNTEKCIKLPKTKREKLLNKPQIGTIIIDESN